MLPATLFIIIKTGNNKEVLWWVNGQTNCYVLILFCNVKESVIIHLKTWMNLKCILSSKEVSWRALDGIRPWSMSPFIWHPAKGKSIEPETNHWLTGLWKSGDKVTYRGQMRTTKLFWMGPKWRIRGTPFVITHRTIKHLAYTKID